MDNQSSNPPETILEDTSLTSFLKLKGHNIIPRITADSKVSFEIEGNPKQIEIDMQAFYGNEKVGIQDFCRCLKETKSALYNLKRVGKK